MIRRRLHGLSRCISYNMNVFHNKTRNEKNFRKQYRVMEEIGRGGFGIVYKGERTDDGAPVAIKFIEHRNVRDWTTVSALVPHSVELSNLL
ncbi:hypothetical protein AB6A40_001974 [Gnathostoma spinigerum]|uniref:non-specific serine/threonine protein kinase n=1 Tax=Gnathostoma spinigerum TaxID=75299 RepID=A0ABD6E6G4_9BILA